MESPRSLNDFRGLRQSGAVRWCAVAVGWIETLNLIVSQLGLTRRGGFRKAVGLLNENFGRMPDRRRLPAQRPARQSLWGDRMVGRISGC
jgi:hypothetical protein